MRRGIPFLAIVASLSLLLLAKILMSSLYLKSASPGVMAVSPAQAEEKKAFELPGRPAHSSEDLINKEKELRDREERLKKKEAELQPLKREVEAKMAELNELQERLSALAKELAEKEKAAKEGKIGHLVSLYGAMEPARAAAIMGKLKMDTVVLILSHMQGKAAGQILSMMDPEKGALISEALSRTE